MAGDQAKEPIGSFRVLCYEDCRNRPFVLSLGTGAVWRVPGSARSHDWSHPKMRGNGVVEPRSSPKGFVKGNYIKPRVEGVPRVCTGLGQECSHSI